MPYPAKNPPTVFVIDDDKQLLDSLVALFEAFEYRVRAFTRTSDFLEHYRPEMPGCLVLDIRMPRQCGLQLYEQLIREHKRLPAIFLAAHADVSTAVAAMKSGAIEFLEKPFDQKTLLQNVQKAIELDTHWRQQDAHFEAIANRVERLSERERETLKLIQAGQSNKSMAAQLELTERAVEMRRASIMEKLKVRSVAELLDLTTTHRILSRQRQECNNGRSNPAIPYNDNRMK
jgi:FixJ family two-component response regulator